MRKVFPRPATYLPYFVKTPRKNVLGIYHKKNKIWELEVYKKSIPIKNFFFQGLRVGKRNPPTIGGKLCKLFPCLGRWLGVFQEKKLLKNLGGDFPKNYPFKFIFNFSCAPPQKGMIRFLVELGIFGLEEGFKNFSFSKKNVPQGGFPFM